MPIASRRSQRWWEQQQEFKAWKERRGLVGKHLLERRDIAKNRTMGPSTGGMVQPEVESRADGERGVICHTKAVICLAQPNADELNLAICANCNRRGDEAYNSWVIERAARLAREKRWRRLKQSHTVTRSF